ncbi:Williams-Beuren syndrome chromosomal region 27 protein [Liparis tanakae]|uniref:Williams-Beuren syndrome chromosomal region 27 protein n=1 Tax=Liparis tanakae TaxID=230148 RepID=A0A4Z2E8N4_9TELE|nr:Williams-Beuren syndrome chromosomal region 27 protein [Liparis tanakae]
MIVGALRPGFVPVSVLRELCLAAKPGGYVCMSRNGLESQSGHQYKLSLEAELQLMEEEGLWSHVTTRETDRYMIDMYKYCDAEQKDKYVHGTMYLYRKSLQ